MHSEKNGYFNNSDMIKTRLMHTTYSDNRKLYKLQTIQVTQISYKGKTRS